MSLITEINSAGQFCELKDEWNILLNSCRDKNVFLTWEYQKLYWKHFGRGRKLRILTAENNGRIIAIAPLRQTRYNPLGFLGFNVIEPLAYSGADYNGLILTEKSAECLDAFLEYLFGNGGWDFIHLYDIHEDSIILQLLPNLHKTIPSYELVDLPNKTCPFISIPESVEVLIKRYDGHSFQKNLRRYMRNLERDHGRVELVDSSQFGSITRAMETLFELHQERWISKGGLGAFKRQENRDFHIDLAKQFADKGWLALYFLTVNDLPIAVSYNYVYDNKMYDCLSGFDPEYSDYSIGNLMKEKVLEKCVEKKIREYDLMKGSEPHKFVWTKTYRTNVGIRFVNQRLTSNLRNWGMHFGRMLRIEKMLKRP